MPPRDRLFSHGALALATLSWGSLPVIIARANAPAPTLVGLRMGFGALALGAFLLLRGSHGLLPRSGRGLVFGLGVLLALHWVVFFRAIQLLGAVAVVITFAFPLLVPLLAPRLIGEEREGHVLPLAALGLAGTAIITASGSGRAQLYGGVLALASAVAAALLVIGARRVVRDVPGPVVAFWQEVVGIVVLAPWIVLSSQGASIPWGWGALMGVVHTAVAGLLFFHAVTHVRAQEVGILMYLEPASAVLFVWVFDRVVPTVLDGLGALLVVGAGVMLVARSTKDTVATPEAGGVPGLTQPAD